MTSRASVEAAPHRIVLVGAGGGSLAPLIRLLGALPAEFPATLFAVAPSAEGHGPFSALTAQGSPLRVELAEDGLPFRRGEVYVAPRDRHLAFQGEMMRVYHAPRENGARPSIDTLFRSAAVEYGARVVGVLLESALGDGGAGLRAIRRCGGITLREEPSNAPSHELRERARQSGPVDYGVSAADLAKLLVDIVQRAIPESPPVPDDLRLEARAAWRAAELAHPAELPSQPVSLSCPECGGCLSRQVGGDVSGYRCHIGHAYSPEVIRALQGLQLENTLWTAVRILKERSALLANMADDSRRHGSSTAEHFEARRRELEEHAATLHRVIPLLTQPDQGADPPAGGYGPQGTGSRPTATSS